MATIWITGASTGIGRALAIALAQQGHQIAISARSEDKLQALAQTINSLPLGSAHSFPLDINDPVAAAQCVADISNTLGSIDWAFLNAAFYEPAPSSQLSLNSFAQHQQTNYMGTLHCLLPLIEQAKLQQNGANIYLTASLAGYRGLPNAAPYNATKAALISLAESLHPDLARQGIHLGVINPGFVQTPLTDKNAFSMPGLLSAEQAADAIVKQMPKKRFQIAFPRRLAWTLNIMRCLPYPWFFWLISRTINKPK